MRILVVEDEKNLNKLIVETLDDEGYSVDGCFDGEEALDYIEGAEYDVIIMDIIMLRMDGLTCVEKMRAKGISTPVVFLTARSSIEDRVKGLESGADYYLVKPFGFDELLAVIRTMTRKYSDNKTNVLTVADLTLNIATKQATRGDREISLSVKEFSLLEYGSFKLKSGDDGVHADNTLSITGGHINIEKCYEGLEAYQVAISGGEIFVISSDDGVNASVGSDEQGLADGIKGFFAPCLNGKFEITGGFIAVNTEGDGLDSNGVMTISGGKTYVAGPTSGGNDAFDCAHMSIKISETEEGDTFVVEITKERFSELVNDNENN